MASQLVAIRDSRAKRIGRWLRDRVWPTLDPPSGNLLDTEESKPAIKPDVNDHVVREVHRLLSVELETETDRRRAVEAKLLAIGSVAPIAVTIMVAAASFLSSGQLRDFVPVSVIVISVLGFYVALQFLRAMQAAISGLSRTGYAVPRISEIVPDDAELLSGYLRKASNDLARRIEQHRKTTNTKVSQLAVAHQSMRNAVSALVFELFILVWLIVWEALS